MLTVLFVRQVVTKKFWLCFCPSDAVGTWHAMNTCMLSRGPSDWLAAVIGWLPHILLSVAISALGSVECQQQILQLAGRAVSTRKHTFWVFGRGPLEPLVLQE